MKTHPPSPGRLLPALQLIATTAASWNLIAPVRPRKRVRRIALHSLARVPTTAVRQSRTDA